VGARRRRSQAIGNAVSNRSGHKPAAWNRRENGNGANKKRLRRRCTTQRDHGKGGGRISTTNNGKEEDPYTGGIKWGGEQGSFEMGVKKAGTKGKKLSPIARGSEAQDKHGEVDPTERIRFEKTWGAKEKSELNLCTWKKG